MSKVGNEVCKTPCGIDLNEKDYSICLLTTLKELEKNYTIAMTEASNDWLYEIYKNSFLEIAALQRKLYTVMFQKGWYQLEGVEASKINDKYNSPPTMEVSSRIMTSAARGCFSV